MFLPAVGATERGRPFKGANVNLSAVRARDAHRHRRWLLLAAAWVAAGCTLTDDSFEPSSVDRAGQLNPEAPNDGLPLPDEAAPSMPPRDGSSGSEGSEGSEPELGDVPLDTPDTGSGGRPGGATGDNADQNGNEGGDAGVGPDLGNEDPNVDAAPQPPLMPPCPGNEFDDSCYEVFAELAAWDVAEQRCLAWGGHLASVQSLEEDAFLDDWPAQLGIPFADGSGIWLGGTDAAVDGDFRWLDGSALSFLGWAPNQPDNGAGIDCIEKRNDGTALWYDRRCSDPRPFMCERPR
jgi:hypothetical protein